MEEKEYVLFIECGSYQSVMSAIKNGDWKLIRIGEMKQEFGRSVPIYSVAGNEIISTVEDIETQEIFQHKSNEKEHSIDFIRLSEIDEVLIEEQEYIDKAIESWQKEITKWQFEKSCIRVFEMMIKDVKQELLPVDKAMKME